MSKGLVGEGVGLDLFHQPQVQQLVLLVAQRREFALDAIGPDAPMLVLILAPQPHHPGEGSLRGKYRRRPHPQLWEF